MKCRNCGSEIQDGKKFCGKCGTPVANKCPKCGKELSPEVKFCPDCGNNLVMKKKAESFENRSSPTKQESPKKKKTSQWIVIAVILFLLVGAGSFCFFRFALPMMNKPAVEADNKSTKEKKDKDTEDKKPRETEPITTKAEEPVETEATTKAEPTTVPSFIWGGSKTNETTAPWSSADETTDTWGGLTDTEETGYVLPDSNSKYLQESDLYGMSLDQLRVARNEIYARHGRTFDSEDLQEYFNRQPWYTGSVSPENFEESVLNSYEKANLEVIKAVEEKLK